MPLKIFRRPGSKIYQVHGSIRGTRVRESTGSSDIRVAEEIRQKIERDLYDRFIHGEKHTRTFGEAAFAYLKADQRSLTTNTHIARLMSHFSKMRLAEIDQAAVENACRVLLRPNVTNATKIRAVFTPLKAVMEHAALSKWCDRPAFRAPEVKKVGTTFLLPPQATALIDAAADHLRPLLVFLLGTGCRCSEALDLQWKDIDLVGARALVWQKQQNFRKIDLPPVVLAALSMLPDRAGYVFRPPARLWRGKVVQAERYADTGREGGGQFATAWGTACRRAGLPGEWHEGKYRYWQPELRVHDLRHTWASWHYAMHKDLLRLKADGGWSTVTMVERYAHLMPAAHTEAARVWLGFGPPGVRQVA